MKIFISSVLVLYLSIIHVMCAEDYYHIQGNLSNGATSSSSANYKSYSIIGQSLAGISETKDSLFAGFIYLIKSQGLISDVHDSYSSIYNSDFDIYIQNPVIDNALLTLKSHSPDRYTLKLVDVNGNIILNLLNDVQVADIKEIRFDISQISMGAYFLVINNRETSQTMKLLIIK